MVCVCACARVCTCVSLATFSSLRGTAKLVANYILPGMKWGKGAEGDADRDVPQNLSRERRKARIQGEEARLKNYRSRWDERNVGVIVRTE